MEPLHPPTVALARAAYGTRAVPGMVLSMARAPSDVLAALWLTRRAGAKLRLAPLGLEDGHGGRGDFLVVVRYALPVGLTERQRELLNEAGDAGPRRASGGAREGGAS